MDSSPESFKNTIFRRKAPPRTLCLHGCGFLGTEANGTLCSKCYKDSLLEGKLSADSVSLPAQTQDHPTVSPCNFLRKRKRNNDDDDGGVIVKKRCRSCSKRVGVMGFECRCGEIFCGAHRHPEAHAREFDFKSAGRLALMKQNPVCKADKLRDRV
ncbi:UNVERIFIED_CONTAM: Zinc finger A20 and AN1 domain-containing stress-associated protein 7 [Sesamum radiatum]|uniref:Zinc finger A20 and AN1 domain-containing stress-associated protein 7 n=1 Tax=Sesamum radiatum TaxID=300843 RepID=A0AAW2KCJ0_SESRA